MSPHRFRGGTRSTSKRLSLPAGTASRAGALVVNGTSTSVTFPVSGWTTWSTLNLTVTLNSGTNNTIAVQSTGNDLANIDDLTFTVSAPAPSSTYQAESATLSGGSFVETTNAGYRGAGYVNFPTTGGVCQFNSVNGGTGGTKTLTIRYANGSTSSRAGALVVNGASVGVTFPTTGGWATWNTLSVAVTLSSGTANTVALQSNGQDLANIDEITVQ